MHLKIYYSFVLKNKIDLKIFLIFDLQKKIIYTLLKHYFDKFNS